MIILDFDGVLFNDERFKKDYWDLFRRFGIPYRVHQTAYREAKAVCRGHYRHDVHLEMIRRKIPSADTRRIMYGIEQLLAGSAVYLYRDARPFLTYWRKRGQRLGLISNGGLFQRKKIAASGLLPFFQIAIVTEEGKSKPIQSIIRRLRNEPGVFIDDKSSVIEEVKQKIPQLSVLQMMRRRRQERSRHADTSVVTLAAVRQLLARREGK